MKLEKVTESSETAAKRWYDDACGAALGMELVGERWSLLIVRELLLGGRRFGELRASLPGISANVLTQRLEGLESYGIVQRRRLPPPVSIQIYELTDWGHEAESVVLELARWALRSPMHDPRLNFSGVSLLLSLKMLLLKDRVGDFAATVGFRLGEESYLATVSDGCLAVRRGDLDETQAVFSGTPNAFLPLFYGGQPLAAVLAGGGIAVSGDQAVAERFSRLFALPEKIA